MACFVVVPPRVGQCGREVAVCMSSNGASRSARRESKDRRSSQQIEDFLTQRALQTLLFYFDQCRDVVSFQFLEDFEDHQGIFQFHGFHGLRLPWENYMKGLLTHPDTTVTVRSHFRRGGSKDNPYLPPKYKEYQHTIEAKQMGRRLMDVRSHLADEMISDLALMENENWELRQRHVEMVRNQEDANFRRLPPKEKEVLWHANSPFRGGSYDLLKKYSIYVATQRVLEALDRDVGRKDAYAWLQAFFEANKATFKTEQKYHLGEAFIEDLWSQTPVVRKRRGGGMNVIDPDSLVESILMERLEVAEDWIECLKDVPQDHVRLNRIVFEGMMQD